MSSAIPTRTRTVATHVIALVQTAKTEPWAGKYRALCRRAGSLVRAGGLVAFLAQLRSEQAKQTAHGQLLEHLRLGWLELKLVAATDLPDGAAMLEHARTATLGPFMELTRRTLLLLRWHKRFSEALIDPDEHDDAPGSEGEKVLVDARRASLFAHARHEVGDNPGLAFSKFVPSFGAKPEVREAMLDAYLSDCPSAACRTVYRGALKRYEKTLERIAPTDGCAVFHLETSTRLIIGLGLKGALQFGLTFHPTYGTPLLPGSSLKGIAAAFADRTGGADWAKDGPQATELFGESQLSGLVDFLDAWWVPPDTDGGSPYEIEIVNPHYGQYHAGGKKQRAPDGMESPVPFKFLAIRAGTRFLFAIRGGEKSADRETARTILEEALASGGVGGKTALGYGRFGPSTAP